MGSSIKSNSSNVYVFEKIQRAEAWGVIRSGPFLVPCFMFSSNAVYTVVENMTFGEVMPSNLDTGLSSPSPFVSVSSSVKLR